MAVTIEDHEADFMADALEKEAEAMERAARSLRTAVERLRKPDQKPR